jgi:hypothetical protein
MYDNWLKTSSSQCLLATLFVLGSFLQLQAADETRAVKVGGLSLTVPKHWKEEPPANRLRLGQFAIPAVEGDKEAAELSIFNFGAGGTVAEQVTRWNEQFEANGRKAQATTGNIENLGKYVFVDLSGTYKKPDGPPILRKTTPQPGSRMLVAMIQTEDGDYFLKLVGPAKTVTAALEAFRNSFGAKAATEKPLEAGL